MQRKWVYILRQTINVKLECGMCIRVGNNLSGGKKNKRLLPTAEFFIFMWCIQGLNAGRGNETKTKEVLFCFVLSLLLCFPT